MIDFYGKCTMLMDVDGSEIRRSPVDMEKILFLNRVSYIPGGAGFLPRDNM